MKKYKLPKEFAEKWLTALRSGDYEQGNEHLLSYEEVDEFTVNYNKKSYCCLGVACSLTEVSEALYSGMSFVSDTYGYEQIEIMAAGYPVEIAGESGFPEILAKFNDGTTIAQYHLEFEFLNLKFRKEPKLGEVYQLTFPEIADFIEDNVEFY